MSYYLRSYRVGLLFSILDCVYRIIVPPGRAWTEGARPYLLAGAVDGVGWWGGGAP